MTEWSSLRSYRCRFCRSQCINEVGSEAEAAEACVRCAGRSSADAVATDGGRSR